MKLTKPKLKQLIREEIEALYAQEQGTESDIVEELMRHAKTIQNCIQQYGAKLMWACWESGTALSSAITKQNWPVAVEAAQALLLCVQKNAPKIDRKCIKTLNSVLKILKEKTGL